MKNLLTILPGLSDATSFYRGVGPLGAMREQSGLNIVMAESITWPYMKLCGGVFIQRPFLHGHNQIIQMAQRCKRKIWIDYDDDLFNLPPDNPMHRIYSEQNIQLTISAAITMADVISVSTPVLQAQMIGILDRIRQSGQNSPNMNLSATKVIVVPNAYDTDCFRDLEKSVLPTPRKLVLWRGSNTHDKDLWTFTPAIKSVIEKHLDWNFHFIGDPFWQTMEALRLTHGVIMGRNLTRTPALDILEYHRFLTEAQPALMIVPLDDSPFNRAKSNIAWLEGLHAGAVTLAPDWPEWRRPGVINYKNEADFADKFDRFLRGERDGPMLWAEGRNYVRENLVLPKVNRLRQLIVEELFTRDKY